MQYLAPWYRNPSVFFVSMAPIFLFDLNPKCSFTGNFECALVENIILHLILTLCGSMSQLLCAEEHPELRR